MEYRATALSIPENDPLQHDALDRGPLIEFLSDLIRQLNGPFVMALDAPWGSGKTTLVEMLKAKLEQDDFKCIYFNAWEVDYVTDPLIAMVSEIDTIDFGQTNFSKEFKEKIKTVKKFLGLIGKRLFVAGVKIATVKAIDIDNESQAIASGMAADTAQDIVDAFQSEKNALKEFRTQLAKAVEVIAKAGKNKNLIFFIDELDRCRPSFAIELLERVKHLFDVENIIFILSIDKEQLEISTASVYGAGIKASEYLRRFIDLEYGIPGAKSGLSTKKYTEKLLSRFGLNDFLKQKEKTAFIEIFTEFSNIMQLSLRARERCITRLSVVLSKTESGETLQPIALVILIILRSSYPEKFYDFFSGILSPDEMMKFLLELHKKINPISNFPSEKEVHASFILMDPDKERFKKNGMLFLQLLMAQQKELKRFI